MHSFQVQASYLLLCRCASRGILCAISSSAHVVGEALLAHARKLLFSRADRSTRSVDALANSLGLLDAGAQGALVALDRVAVRVRGLVGFESARAVNQLLLLAAREPAGRVGGRAAANARLQLRGAGLDTLQHSRRR